MPRLKRWLLAIILRAPMGEVEALVLIVTGGAAILGAVSLLPGPTVPPWPLWETALWWVVVVAAGLLLLRGITGVVGVGTAAARRGLQTRRGHPSRPSGLTVSDAVQIEVQRAPASSMLPFVAYETQGRKEHGIPLQGHPITLRFELPVTKTVREHKLPVTLKWDVGKRLEILRFYDGGVTTTEHTSGDRVKFVPYYKPQLTPVNLDTSTRIKELPIDAVIAPAPPTDAATAQPFVDFMDTPDEHFAAKVFDTMIGLDEQRRQRAEVRAYDSLRHVRDRDPDPSVVRRYARWLYERSDTALEVTEDQVRAWVNWKGTRPKDDAE